MAGRCPCTAHKSPAYRGPVSASARKMRAGPHARMGHVDLGALAFSFASISAGVSRRSRRGPSAQGAVVHEPDRLNAVLVS